MNIPHEITNQPENPFQRFDLLKIQQKCKNWEPEGKPDPGHREMLDPNKLQVSVWVTDEIKKMKKTGSIEPDDLGQNRIPVKL